MRIIDLLNKIANGEEDDLITEFEFNKRVWNFKGLNDSEFCLDGWLLNQNITITKHKEILDDEEKGLPEKITMCTSGIMGFDSVENITTELKDKINKIIDYLEKQRMINFSKEQMYNTINTITNEELNLETARKMIANLVVENADMQRKIIKAIEHLKIKQARLINEKDYVITDLDLDGIMQDLESKGEDE